MNSSSHNNTIEKATMGSCTSCGVGRNSGERCNYCGTIYLDTIKRRSEKRKLEDSQHNSLSSKYKISKSTDELKISWSWRNASTYFLIPFFIFWNSIAFSFFNLAQAIDSPLSLFPIPGLHIIIGILGPLYVVVSFINKTTIVVNNRYLMLKHQPLPVGKKHRFPADQIAHLFVSKTQKSSKRHTWDVPELQLVTTDGTRHRLMKGSREVEFADYEALRRQISKELDLPLTA